MSKNIFRETSKLRLDKDPDSEFFRETVEVVGLGFNDPRSVDVLIDQLNEIKKAMSEHI